MALFVCSCENKTYAGFFNNKDCKDCGTEVRAYNKYDGVERMLERRKCCDCGRDKQRSSRKQAKA